MICNVNNVKYLGTSHISNFYDVCVQMHLSKDHWIWKYNDNRDPGEIYFKELALLKGDTYTKILKPYKANGDEFCDFEKLGSPYTIMYWYGKDNTNSPVLGWYHSLGGYMKHSSPQSTQAFLDSKSIEIHDQFVEMCKWISKEQTRVHFEHIINLK